MLVSSRLECAWGGNNFARTKHPRSVNSATFSVMSRETQKVSVATLVWEDAHRTCGSRDHCFRRVVGLLDSKYAESWKGSRLCFDFVSMVSSSHWSVTESPMTQSSRSASSPARCWAPILLFHFGCIRLTLSRPVLFGGFDSMSRSRTLECPSVPEEGSSPSEELESLKLRNLIPFCASDRWATQATISRRVSSEY